SERPAGHAAVADDREAPRARPRGAALRVLALRRGSGRRARVERWARALDDGLAVDARRQRPEGEPAIAREPGRTERLGDGGRRVAQEERALQGEGHVLDQPPGAALDGGEVAQLDAQSLDEGVEARVGAAGEADLGEEGLDRFRAAAHGAQ